MSRISKSRETESRLTVPRAEGLEGIGTDGNVYSIYFWGDKNVLKLTAVMVDQL